MKKIILILSLLTLICSARADTITATLTITGTPANGATIANGTDIRTWTTGTITTPATQIAVTNTTLLNASNLFYHLSASKFSGMRAQWPASTNIVTFFGNAPLALTASAGWCTVSYVTNTAGDSQYLTAPWAANGTTTAVYQASQTISGLDANTTNAFSSSSPALTNHVALSTAQTITGLKTLTGANTYSNAAQMFSGGIVTNVTIYTPNIQVGSSLSINSGGINLTNATINVNNLAGTLTTGLDSGGNFTGASYTLLATFGSVGSPAFEIVQDGSGFVALDTSLNGGYLSFGPVDGPYPIQFHNGDISSTGNTHISSNLFVGAGAYIVGSLTNLTTTGANTLGGIIGFPRLANTSLANGNNAGVSPGTSLFIQVSGPTAAFAINGIAGGSDGRMLMIQNSTGYTLTIANDSGVDSTAANRIYTGTGADVTEANNPGCIILIYNASVSRWILWSKN